MNKKILVREFEDDTDIYICGCDFEGVPESFSLTDDESSIDIIIAGRRIFMTTSGFVHILTAEEFIAIKDKMYSDWGEIIFVSDFKGKIELIVDSKSEKVEFRDDFNIMDYSWYQLNNPDDETYEINLLLNGFFWAYLFPSKAIQNLIYTNE